NRLGADRHTVNLGPRPFLFAGSDQLDRSRGLLRLVIDLIVLVWQLLEQRRVHRQLDRRPRFATTATATTCTAASTTHDGYLSDSKFGSAVAADVRRRPPVDSMHAVLEFVRGEARQRSGSPTGV